MTRGPLFSQLVGLGIIAGLVPLSLAFPSEIGKTVLSPKNDATDGDDLRQTASPSLWKQGVVIVRDMLYRDWQLTVILIGFMFTVLGRYEVILRFQYATKRYGWSWGDVSRINFLSATRITKFENNNRQAYSLHSMRLSTSAWSRLFCLLLQESFYGINLHRPEKTYGLPEAPLWHMFSAA
jgi:hypothetical protein